MRSVRIGRKLLVTCLLGCSVGFAQYSPTQYRAEERVFIGTGPGTRAIAYAGGRYYALVHSDRSVLVYREEGTFVGRVGSFGQGPGDLSAPRDVWVDRESRIYVADWGANKIKIFDKRGEYLHSFSFLGPKAVAVLSSGEICVVGSPTEHLISVFDQRGQFVRGFGDPLQIVDEPQLNAFLNFGKIAVDRQDNIYFAFFFSPSPTVRKYSRNGALLLEFRPDGEKIRAGVVEAQTGITRKLREGGVGGSGVLTNIALDERSGDIWVSSASHIYRYDSQGKLRDVLKTFTPDGTAMNADEVVIIGESVFIGSLPQGVFRFRYPDRRR
ncbi:MAG: NHL repeat-containing protein [Terriglobia bacterium]